MKGVHLAWQGGQWCYFFSSKTVEPAEREPPRTATNTVSVGGDAGAEVAAAKVLGVEERHFGGRGGDLGMLG